MSDWPKTIYVGKVAITAHSWEDLDQLIERYGGEFSVLISKGEQAAGTSRRSDLSPSDRALLQKFVEGSTRGITTRELSEAIGKRGKAIRPYLEAWSRRIGLVKEENASAFQAIQRAEGRGFRLTDLYLSAAREMLGK